MTASPGVLRPSALLRAGLAVATVLTLLFPTQNYMALRAGRMLAARAGRPLPPEIPWTTLLLGELPVWYTWLLLAPLVFRLARRFPVVGPGWPRALPVHVGASLVITALVLLVTTAVQRALGMVRVPLGYLESVWIAYLTYFAYFLVIYAGILTASHAVQYYGAFQRRRLQASQLETQLAHAQLSALKTQLQPHFLFNTLNSIASLMHRDLASAQRTLVLLSDLLRLSLENAASHEVPLRQEIDFLDRYLEIQRIRFRDRLRVEYRVDPATERLLVPRLLLQPLVENAIRHGVERKVGPVIIEVTSALDADRVRLEVRDDGPGLATDGIPPTRRGIGLRNTELRLEQLYGAEQALVLESLEPSGVAVRIEIPRREQARA